MKKNKAFDKNIVAHLRKYAADAEEKGALHKEQLKLIYTYKWFKIFVPKEYNGLALNLPDALLLEEQLAFIDGSLGWTITLCAGANFFAGYIDKKIAAKIFTNPKVCLGGSGAVTGTAAITNNGFLVNGYWKYATGAPHLTHFTANCVIQHNGKPVVNHLNQPLVQSFFFKKNEVTIIKDWNTPGLKATAGHSFAIKRLEIPKERTFVIDTSKATHTHPVYQYPFLQFAELTLAVNTLGMARHFLSEAASIMTQRKKHKKITVRQFNYAFQQLAEAKRSINKWRNDFYGVARASWKELLRAGIVEKKTLSSISKVSLQLVKECRRQVAAIYPYCGLSAVNNNSEIARIFRDIFTASQHTLLNYPGV
jgi:alkylation response protein AidB-like acyl-CoA dehydrogenase